MKLLTVAISGLIAASAAFGAQATASTKPEQAQVAPSKVTLSRIERNQLTAQIVRQWSGYVRQAYGTDPKVWAAAMAGTFASADPVNLRRAAAMTTYEGMTATLLGQHITDTQVINKLAAANSPAVAQTLGSPANDLVYTMVTPCRIVDTRAAGGVIAANTTRSFESSRPAGNFANQGGAAASDCGIPASPSAVVMNVTVVSPNKPGYLTVFPFNVARPTSASLNYTTGAVTGNEIIVRQTIGQASDFSVYSLGQTHVVVDVVGYFMAPVATALDCTTTASGPSVLIPDTGVAQGVDAPACAAGYARTGVYCLVSGNEGVVNESYQGGCYFLDKAPGNAVTDTASVRTSCCRVPGR